MEKLKDRLKKILNAEHFTLEDRDWLLKYLNSATDFHLFTDHLDVDDEKIEPLPRETSINILAAIKSKIDTRERRRSREKMIAISIAASFVFVLASWHFNFLNVLMPSTSYYSTVTNAGEIKKINLVDGTRIVLSPNSKVVSPNHFNGNSREVTLIGDANFEINDSFTQPFIIHSSKVNAKETGRNFSIRVNRNQQSIQVSITQESVDESGILRLEHRERPLLNKVDLISVEELSKGASASDKHEYDIFNIYNSYMLRNAFDSQEKVNNNALVEHDRNVIHKKLQSKPDIILLTTPDKHHNRLTS
ncbi:anti-FecI sigma factor, FecR [Arcticibacter svalbardensis MN12-7]|uniref:Anti-FecI sigma factor, FecR n=1 Tax=Arcticibacter svalbardensis MN12-7 TaxID=1150600 RepID=R9GMU7_9SPHI|nr:FecR family protein [Arcticibacter svalbardensis]EOR93053.1 anti-FecI sigma factor, FecR [Arcticibacter svalbardensis MN12-7]